MWIWLNAKQIFALDALIERVRLEPEAPLAFDAIRIKVKRAIEKLEDDGRDDRGYLIAEP